MSLGVHIQERGSIKLKIERFSKKNQMDKSIEGKKAKKPEFS